MNNKGFMMAEVVVVSAIVLVTLTTLYISYNKILSIYNQRVDYYDVKTLYKLAYIRDTNYEKMINNLTPDWEPITENSSTYDKIYYVDKASLKGSLPTGINETYKDYINYLKDSINSETQNIIIMESCPTSNNCKYAYLEVFPNEKTE